MSVVAIYRLLYGSDFIAESLASIYDSVDHILCFVTSEIFGGRRVVKYFGHDVYIPHDIDGVTDAIAAFKREHDPADKIRIMHNPFGADLKNQVGRMLNSIVLPNFNCTHVLFVEGDEVWREDALAALLELARDSDADEFMSSCHLFWRSYKYASTRTNPYCVLRALKGAKQVGTTGHALAQISPTLKQVRDPRIVVHNFGYAASERTTFWKHIAGLSFSRDARLDSAPREDWFEQVWRPWNWTTNRRTDLCPSIGYPDAFAPAREYEFNDLPSVMQARIVSRPLTEWASADSPVAAGAAR